MIQHPPGCPCHGCLPDSEEKEGGPEQNYECVVCGTKAHIDDYRKRTYAWCSGCGEVRYHLRFSND